MNLLLPSCSNSYLVIYYLVGWLLLLLIVVVITPSHCWRLIAFRLLVTFLTLPVADIYLDWNNLLPLVVVVDLIPRVGLFAQLPLPPFNLTFVDLPCYYRFVWDLPPLLYVEHYPAFIYVVDVVVVICVLITCSCCQFTPVYCWLLVGCDYCDLLRLFGWWTLLHYSPLLLVHLVGWCCWFTRFTDLYLHVIHLVVCCWFAHIAPLPLLLLLVDAVYLLVVDGPLLGYGCQQLPVCWLVGGWTLCFIWLVGLDLNLPLAPLAFTFALLDPLYLYVGCWLPVVYVASSPYPRIPQRLLLPVGFFGFITGLFPHLFGLLVTFVYSPLLPPQPPALPLAVVVILFCCVVVVIYPRP